tara:strand:+ start:36 stop:683 length:648 start_codon:yes stop_codon:yes gene_type:complete
MSKNFTKRIITSLILFLVLLLMFNFFPVLIFVLLVLSILSILEFINIIRKINDNNLLRFFLISFFIIYIVFFSVAFAILSIIDLSKFILFAILLGCVASDLGGYIFGKTFKGSKLTKISPKKTISGAIGSLILTTIVVSGLIFYISNNLNIKIIAISIFISIACQTGDLFFSYLKRKAKVKDTSNFLPGHGGVLDRIDGIIMGVPVGYITLIFFN